MGFTVRCRTVCSAERLCKYAWSTVLCVHSRNFFLLFRALPEVAYCIYRALPGELSSATATALPKVLFYVIEPYRSALTFDTKPFWECFLLFRALSGSAFFDQNPTGGAHFCYRAIPGLLACVTEPYRKCSLLLQRPTGGSLFCYGALKEHCMLSCLTELYRKCFPVLQSCNGSALFCYSTLPKAFVADFFRKYKFSCYRILKRQCYHCRLRSYWKCSLLQVFETIPEVLSFANELSRKRSLVS